MPVIEIKSGKTLKLKNVLCVTFPFDAMGRFDVFALQMDNYIRTMGAQPIGPLIQTTYVKAGLDGKPELFVRLFRQADKYINIDNEKYSIQSVLKIKNCLYTRFCGSKENLQIAQQKINVTAYEKGFRLSGDIYYVYLSAKNDEIAVDIFAECVEKD